MSTMSPSTQVRETLRDSRAARLLRRPVEAFAFWTAILLPFVYLPMLFGGFETTTSVLLFAGLLAANGVALLVGHGHKRD